MPIPYHHVNVLTGFKAARQIEHISEYAEVIKRARRPLFVLGRLTATVILPNGKYLMEYAVGIAKAGNLPVCATAHTKKKLLELGLTPECTYDIIEIINRLKDKDWHGVKKEGYHDLVMFLGLRTDLANAGLSTLKHFALHLKTMTLGRYYYPHADNSLWNLKDDNEWIEVLEGLIVHLKGKEV